MDNYYFKHPAHFGDMFGIFEDFYRSNTLADVIISCDGKTLHAHRIVLSAGSDYFRRVLLSVKQSSQFPILFIGDIAYDDMETILEFIYRGQIVVTRDKVDSLRQAAHKLRIKGFEHFLRKPFNSNVTPTPPNLAIDRANNHHHNAPTNANMRLMSLLNSEKRALHSSNVEQQQHYKRIKSSHHHQSMSSKDSLIFNRFKDELKRLSNGNEHRSLPFSNALPKRIQLEKLLKRNMQAESAAVAAAAVSASQHKPRCDSPKSREDSMRNKVESNPDSIVMTQNNNSNSPNRNSPQNELFEDECDDNQRNENAENSAVEQNGGGDESGNADEMAEMNEHFVRPNVDRDDSDDEQEENYTYEMDPNSLNWGSFNDENTPQECQDDGSDGIGYEDDEDCFESMSRSAQSGATGAISLAQADLLKLRGQLSNMQGGFFYCDHCPKFFYDEDHLQVHIKRSHGLNKLNQCNICGKTYAWKSGLYKHKRHVHGITSGKTLTNITVDNVKGGGGGSGGGGGEQSPQSPLSPQMPMSMPLPLSLTSGVSLPNLIEAAKLMEQPAGIKA